MDFVITEPPRVRLAIEVDDQSTHDPARINREKFNDHLARQNELMKEGYTLLRFTVPQVRDTPMACVDDIRVMLDRLRRSGDSPRVVQPPPVAGSPSSNGLPWLLGVAALIVIGVLATRAFGAAETPPRATASATVTPGANGECRAPAVIKGNVAKQSDGSFSKIYHVPGGAFYASTNAEACFSSDADAVLAGYRRSAR